jgi:membrane-bound lytic murein transglycosylase A
VAPDRVVLSPANFADLPGWSRDDPLGALAAFERSCGVLKKMPSSAPIGPRAMAGHAGAWREPCLAAQGAVRGTLTGESARRFFERHFRPFSVTGSEGNQGLFTAYFEISLRGARRRSARYHVPLYRRPNDLVTADLGTFSQKWRGRSIAGRVRGGRLVPYADRRAINTGALTGKALELLWLDDPVDAFFLHIQGSGRVRLKDGSVTRVGYAGKNGHAYTSIGRILIKMGALERGAVTMQSIRAWLAANPDKARALLVKNRSFVFFREFSGAGPIGTQGVALIANRSLAVDRAFLPLGAPMFVSAADAQGKLGPVQKLMVAQDTGGAIRGPIRGDMFLGHGRAAADIAGRTRMAGRYWILLPHSVAQRALAAQ